MVIMANDFPECSVCQAQPPQVKCYCMEAPISLCSSCAVSHFLEEMETAHHPYPADVHSEDGSKCEVCQMSAAESICTCLFPWISYCNDCASNHVAYSASHLKHTLEPLHAKDFLESSASLPGYYERQHFIESLQASVTHNLARIDDAIFQLDQVAGELISSIEGWRLSETRRLLSMKENITAKVKLCFEQLEQLRFKKDIEAKNRVEQIVQTCTRENSESAMKEMNMVSVAIDSEKVIRQLPYVFTCTENYQMFDIVDKLYFAVSKSTRLLSLDLPNVHITETSLDTEYRFKPHSAWCKLPSGQLFLCGGQLTKETAVYYKEAILIDVCSRKIEPLATMAGERCRHGIVCYKDFVYVFGGYCNEYLASCERYSLSQKCWSQLPDLNEAKDCITVAVWKDRIYIVGYGSNKIEAFDVSTESTFVLPITLRPAFINLLIPIYCALISIDAGELIIITESELIRVSIEGQSIRSTELPTKIERHWYTQCPPVTIRGENVYFFSLEGELWRLGVQTSELTFVMKVKSN